MTFHFSIIIPYAYVQFHFRAIILFTMYVHKGIDLQKDKVQD